MAHKPSPGPPTALGWRRRAGQEPSLAAEAILAAPLPTTGEKERHEAKDRRPDLRQKQYVTATIPDMPLARVFLVPLEAREGMLGSLSPVSSRLSTRSATLSKPVAAKTQRFRSEPAASMIASSTLGHGHGGRFSAEPLLNGNNTDLFLVTTNDLWTTSSAANIGASGKRRSGRATRLARDAAIGEIEQRWKASLQAGRFGAGKLDRLTKLGNLTSQRRLVLGGNPDQAPVLVIYCENPCWREDKEREGAHQTAMTLLTLRPLVLAPGPDSDSEGQQMMASRG
ncbi:hypothetical protein FALBO_1127 [Fusarium albosuccineum]|uniref:Uncharacterized protein n=1 Tax=Fusarium albosuccineum TaxID=1237068 RepID=A0A8H4PHU9_9HYPO|nr:hypothetical protein FALBO_1127 [Fusarium albosuccineum]